MYTILFLHTTGEFGFLSNFSYYPILIGGKRYPTTEHYYQSQKTLDIAIQESIRKAPTPKEAKTIAQDIELREDWEDIKDTIMMIALMAKVKQHQSVKRRLLATNDVEIVEDNPHDYYWSRGKTHTGKNKLGKMWMLIRSAILPQT